MRFYIAIISIAAFALLLSECADSADVPATQALTSQNEADTSSGTFSIGDNIDVARKILDKYHKPNSIGGFAFARLPDDEENIIVTIDPDHMYLCILYSKSDREIHRMSAVCFPSRRHGKVNESWIPIRRIQLNQDSTHTLTFTKPLTVAELDARDKAAAENLSNPQLPPSSFGK